MKNGGKGYAIFISFVAALDELLFGYHRIVIGGAKPSYESFFGIGSADLFSTFIVFRIMGGLAIAVAAIACYSASPASAMWIVVSEIFPTAMRGAAMGVATFGAMDGLLRFHLYVPYVECRT